MLFYKAKVTTRMKRAVVLKTVPLDNLEKNGLDKARSADSADK
jgi:hypothetical protein